MVELQPLGRKDAATLATALRQVLDSIVPAIVAGTGGRFTRIAPCLARHGIFMCDSTLRSCACCSPRILSTAAPAARQWPRT
eukprot:7094271-Alexandrium_andersonii.AAC.1